MATFPKYKIDPDSEVKGTGAGYIYVTTTPDYAGESGIKMPEHTKTYVPLHIIKMEQKLNRYIKPSKGEEVHHKNENKADDSLSNLELSTKRDHPRQHALHGNPFWKKSPRTKPRTAFLHKVINNYLSGN